MIDLMSRRQLVFDLQPPSRWGGRQKGAGRKPGPSPRDSHRARPPLACERGRFRLTHYSVQSDHLHLIVEAGSSRDLASGMKAIGARLACAANRVFGRGGRVLLDRYHRRMLRTPREVRHAIAYVLLNARRHLAKRG